MGGKEGSLCESTVKISDHLKLVTSKLTGTQGLRCRVRYIYTDRHTLVFVGYLDSAFSPLLESLEGRSWVIGCS